jgi:hypothetical protein
MSRLKFISITVVVLIVIVTGYYILNAPDQRDAGQKIGDAIKELPNGTDKAARQLEDRTPGKKLEDATQDEKQDIKKALNQQ